MDYSLPVLGRPIPDGFMGNEELCPICGHDKTGHFEERHLLLAATNLRYWKALPCKDCGCVAAIQ